MPENQKDIKYVFLWVSNFALLVLGGKFRDQEGLDGE